MSANLPGYYPVRIMLQLNADLTIDPLTGVIGTTCLFDAPVKWGFPADVPEHVAEGLTKQLGADVTRIVEHLFRAGLENSELRKQHEQHEQQEKVQ